MKEIAASKDLFASGASFLPKNILKIMLLATLFVLLDDSDLEDAILEAAAVEIGTFVQEIVAAQREIS